MSYILDALRKSEQERRVRAGDIPDLSTSHVGSSGSGSLPGYWLGGLLLLMGVGVVVYLLWTPRSTPEVAQTSSRNSANLASEVAARPPAAPRPGEAAGVTEGPVAVVDPPASETRVPVVEARPAPVPPSPPLTTRESLQPRYAGAPKGGHLAEKLRELASADASGDGNETPAKPPGRPVAVPPAPGKVPVTPAPGTRDLVAEIVKEARAKAAKQPEPAIQPPPAPEVTNRVQSATTAAEPAPVESERDLHYRSLPAAQHNGVPVTTVTVHVYYDDPAKRFILADRRRYQEGDAMPDGVRLESITRRGIILEYQGKQYRYDVRTGG